MLVRIFSHPLVKVGIVFLVFYFFAGFVKNIDFQLAFLLMTCLKWRILLILFISFLAYLMATLAWMLCLQILSGKTIKLFELFSIRLVGESVSLILPINMIGGELTKLWYLNKSGINRQEALLSILISRGLVIISYLFLMLLSILFVHHKYSENLQNTGFIFLAILFVILLSVAASIKLYAYTNNKSFYNYFLIPLEKIRSFLSEKGLTFSGIKYYLLLAFFLSAVHWLIGVFEFYILLNSVGSPISYGNAMTLELGVMIFKSIGCFIPGQIGIEEMGNKVLLESINIHSNEIWLAVSLMRRMRQIFWVLFGIILLIYLKIKKNENIIRVA